MCSPLQLHRLCTGKLVSTVTSMEASSLLLSKTGDASPSQDASSSGNSSAVSALDHPGHERLRSGLSEHLAEAKVIIFVVDASDLASQVR